MSKILNFFKKILFNTESKRLKNEIEIIKNKIEIIKKSIEKKSVNKNVEEENDKTIKSVISVLDKDIEPNRLKYKEAIDFLFPEDEKELSRKQICHLRASGNVLLSGGRGVWDIGERQQVLNKIKEQLPERR